MFDRYDFHVNKVKLLEANILYVYVQHPGEWQMNIYLRNLVEREEQLSSKAVFNPADSNDNTMLLNSLKRQSFKDTDNKEIGLTPEWLPQNKTVLPQILIANIQKQTVPLQEGDKKYTRQNTSGQLFP